MHRLLVFLLMAFFPSFENSTCPNTRNTAFANVLFCVCLVTDSEQVTIFCAPLYEMSANKMVQEVLNLLFIVFSFFHQRKTDGRERGFERNKQSKIEY